MFSSPNLLGGCLAVAGTAIEDKVYLQIFWQLKIGNLFIIPNYKSAIINVSNSPFSSRQFKIIRLCENLRLVLFSLLAI